MPLVCRWCCSGICTSRTIAMHCPGNTYCRGLICTLSKTTSIWPRTSKPIRRHGRWSTSRLCSSNNSKISVPALQHTLAPASLCPMRCWRCCPTRRCLQTTNSACSCCGPVCAQTGKISSSAFRCMPNWLRWPRRWARPNRSPMPRISFCATSRCGFTLPGWARRCGAAMCASLN